MGKRGRPSKFNLSLAKRILVLVQEGKTDEQVARAIGVSWAAFKNWKANKPDFLAAVQDAKSVADELVEATLFNRATGYKHKAVKFFFDKDTGKIYSKRYIQHYPPDTIACTFWLKNRKPKYWRDKNEVSFPDREGNPQSITGDKYATMTLEELKTERERLQRIIQETE